MEEKTVHPGIDVLPDDRLLVGVSALEWTLDASAKTIKRWAATGLMPKPYRIGKSIRWNAQELRDWIEDGCQPVSADSGG